MSATEPTTANPGATAPATVCCPTTTLQACCPSEDKGECCGIPAGASTAEAPSSCGCR